MIGNVALFIFLFQFWNNLW